MNTSSAPKSRLCPLLTIAALGLLASLALPARPAFCQGIRLGNVRVSLKASPTFLPADGKSRSRILIEVRDRNNAPMPDGTPIFCYTDLGVVSLSEASKVPSLSTVSRGGYATIYCSSDWSGPAKVTVKVQDSSNEVTLQFLPEGVSMRDELRVVTITGGWVAYSPETNTIQARDNATARFGELTISAVDGLEIDMTTQTMRAWTVEVKRGADVITGEDVFFELGVGRGVVRRFGDEGLERIYFTAYDVRGCRSTWEVPDGAFQSQQMDGDTWLVCDECKFFLGERVVLKGAALYAADKKVLRLPPIWVIGLDGYYGASNSQVLGLSSDGGLGVDLPIFYRVTDKWSGAVRVQKGASGSSFMAREGWSVGVAEEYNSGEVRGRLGVGGIGAADWGLGWEDERPIFGDAQGYFSIVSPDHKSVFADANVYYYADAYRLNLRSQMDSPEDGGMNANIAADILTEPRCLIGKTTYRLGTTLGARRVDQADKEWRFENELYAGIDLGSRTLGPKTTVNFGVSDVFAWDTDDYAANSARAELRMSHNFTPRTRLGLSYYATQRNGDTSRQGLSHLVGMDFSSAQGKDWLFAANGTWDVTQGDTYGFASIDKYFRSGWRAGASGIHYDSLNTGYDDLELSLGKEVAGREIGLRYSFESSRISLELGTFFGR